jgi:hypothetical protein
VLLRYGAWDSGKHRVCLHTSMFPFIHLVAENVSSASRFESMPSDDPVRVAGWIWADHRGELKEAMYSVDGSGLGGACLGRECRGLTTPPGFVRDAASSTTLSSHVLISHSCAASLLCDGYCATHTDLVAGLATFRTIQQFDCCASTCSGHFSPVSDSLMN